MTDLMEVLKGFYEHNIKSETGIIRVKGKWDTEYRINIIKKVNHMEGKYKLTAEYIEDKDETIISYMIRRDN